MNVKLRALTAGVLFFAGGQALLAQEVKTDSTAKKENQIEGVVIVAYGKQKKEAVVGAVTTVDSKTLSTQQAPSVLSALQGTTAGVNVIGSGGNPGESPKIYIRGVGSINASAEPLIVLDGVPFNGNINSIPQDQIESMTTLKDASSTALYGSRGANGVILITTKSGKLNRPASFNLTSIIGVSSPSVKLYDRLSSEDFMKYTWQAIRNRELYKSATPRTAAEAGQIASNTLISTLGYNPYNVATPIDANGNLVPGARLLWDTDWENLILNKSAFKQEHRFDVSGGDRKTTYYFAADYLKMDGAVKTSGFERVGVRLNVDSKVKDWLKVGLRSSYNASEQDYPVQSGTSTANAMQWINSVPGIYPVYRVDENGNFIYDAVGDKIYDYGNNKGNLNATRPVLGSMNLLGKLAYDKIKNRRYNVLVNGYAEAQIFPDLTLKSQLGYEHFTLDTNEYNHYAYGTAANVGGRVTQSRIFGKTINFINSLNYNKKFGNHGIDALGVFEVYQYKYDYLRAQGTGFLPNVYVLSGSTTPEGVEGYINQERLVSYLGRLSYNYDNKYFLEGSYRRDGSSRFSQDVRWGDFYSVGASWVVSREGFLRNSSWINNLKLRGSYGELGNNKTRIDNKDAYFPYLTMYSTGYNQLGQTGVVLGSLVDPLLTWEKTASANIGLDFGFFNNRISGNVEYFEKKSVDLLYSRPLALSTGNKDYLTNVGGLKNYGWEFNINTVNVESEKFFWRSNLNLTFVKNKITELTQESFINGTKRWAVGQSIYDFYLPVWVGVDPADGMGMWRTNIVDAQGQTAYGVTKDYAVANQQKNRAYVGSSLPDFTGGFTNYFKVGNFDLNVLFNFSFGSYMYDSSYANLMSGFSEAGTQQSVDVKNAWQKPGDITNVPVNIMTNNSNNSLSTRFLFKNNYIRLKSLTLGYTIPNDLVERFGANSLKIFLQGDNLWTWQSHKGIDPEQGIAGTTDSRSYSLRTVSLGVTLNF